MLLISLLSLLECYTVNAWSSDELAMYDLVEEIGQNFYEIYGIDKDAPLFEVKKAYRRLSLEWHPDRNADPNAEGQFRKIASIYEILKTSDLREKYNNVLEFGLPNWKQPVYYYRRARKLSWMEAIFVLVIIFSIGHYLMLWGAYVDKYLALTSNRNKLRKKEKRMLRKSGLVGTDVSYEDEISKSLLDIWPSWRHLLPLLFVNFMCRLLLALLRLIYGHFNVLCRGNNDAKSNDKTLYIRRQTTAPQPAYEFAVASDVKPVLTRFTCEENLSNDEISASDATQDKQWTSDELSLLVKLSTEKYPAGTQNRWNLMAKALDRSPENIIAMVGKLKQMKFCEYNSLLCVDQTSGVVQKIIGSEKSKSVVCDGASSSVKASDEWTQHDQRLFEAALQQFPRGTADRWEKIVNCVPNKTKQQCIDRFKYLSEMVRQKKSLHRSKK